MGLVHIPQQLGMLDDGAGHALGHGLQAGSAGRLKVPGGPADLGVLQPAEVGFLVSSVQDRQLPPQRQYRLLYTKPQIVNPQPQRARRVNA